jgi:membrane-associated HD superfamily phosphohydrolase
MNANRTATLVLTWLGVFAFRFFLLPFRAPNVEPLMAALMPIGKRAGMFASIFFAVTSIVLYDAVTAGWGSWTLAAAGAYALVALAASFYFRFAPSTRAHFVGFGIVATLAYDVLTGLTVGPIIFHQSFAEALAGQIPFTILHLASTVLFALVLSPFLDKILASDTQEARAQQPQSA